MAWRTKILCCHTYNDSWEQSNTNPRIAPDIPAMLTRTTETLCQPEVWTNLSTKSFNIFGSLESFPEQVKYTPFSINTSSCKTPLACDDNATVESCHATSTQAGRCTLKGHFAPPRWHPNYRSSLISSIVRNWHPLVCMAPLIGCPPLLTRNSGSIHGSGEHSLVRYLPGQIRAKVGLSVGFSFDWPLIHGQPHPADMQLLIFI